MFKTELHAHCAPVSSCASITPSELVEKYKAAGYTTLVLANHLSPYTYYENDQWPWKEKLAYYIACWEAVQKAAARQLHVLLGAEIRTTATPNDYLCFGLTPQTLAQLPDTLLEMSIPRMTAAVHQLGGVVYQAHPMRFGMELMNPQTCGLDGLEVYNAHLNHDSHNDVTALWAAKLGVKTISGSDCHDPWSHIGGGIVTQEPITTSEQLLGVLAEEAYTLIRE